MGKYKNIEYDYVQRVQNDKPNRLSELKVQVVWPPIQNLILYTVDQVLISLNNVYKALRDVFCTCIGVLHHGAYDCIEDTIELVKNRFFWA
jgi:hypothetical protein